MVNLSIVRNKLEKLREQARRIKEDERLRHEPDNHVLKEASDNAFLMCEPQFNSIEAAHSAYDHGFYNAMKKLKELKEHEAVKPVLDKQTGRIWLCGKCGSYVGFEDNDPHDPNEFDKYCRECGRKVKWNE